VRRIDALLPRGHPPRLLSLMMTAPAEKKMVPPVSHVWLSAGVGFDCAFRPARTRWSSGA